MRKDFQIFFGIKLMLLNYADQLNELCINVKIYICIYLNLKSITNPKIFKFDSDRFYVRQIMNNY